MLNFAVVLATGVAVLFTFRWSDIFIMWQENIWASYRKVMAVAFTEWCCGAYSPKGVRFHRTSSDFSTPSLFVSDTGRKLHRWHFVWRYSSLGPIVLLGWGRWKFGKVAQIFANLLHIDNSAPMVLGYFLGVHTTILEHKLTGLSTSYRIIKSLLVSSFSARAITIIQQVF